MDAAPDGQDGAEEPEWAEPPLTGLVRTLNALISGIAVQLGQIRDQGLVGGSAAPAEPQAEAAPAEAEAPAEEAPAEESPAETAEEPAAEADTPDTTENQTDAAADADDASDAKED